MINLAPSLVLPIPRYVILTYQGIQGLLAINSATHFKVLLQCGHIGLSGHIRLSRVDLMKCVSVSTPKYVILSYWGVQGLRSYQYGPTFGITKRKPQDIAESHKFKLTKFYSYLFTTGEI